jgi:glutathione synthase/RimK-type ligase-like ATP-grasp enzyme
VRHLLQHTSGLPLTSCDTRAEAATLAEYAAELRAIALACGRAFGIELYGLDIIISDGRPYVVDISSFPGFKGVPDAGLRLADYIYAATERVLNGEPAVPGVAEQGVVA